jgi:hypothetical protein
VEQRRAAELMAALSAMTFPNMPRPNLLVELLLDGGEGEERQVLVRVAALREHKLGS